MLSFGDPDPEILYIVTMVVDQLERDANIDPSDVMVIGAHARDIIHSGLGHGGGLRPLASAGVHDLLLDRRALVRGAGAFHRPGRPPAT